MLRGGTYIDYKKYVFRVREWVFYGLQGIGLILTAALLFYNSLWAAIPGCPFLWFFYRWKKRELAARRKKELCIQFREGIRSLAEALRVGLAVENALREAAGDLRMMEWKENYMACEFESIQYKIAAGQTVESGFEDLARRSGIEDIQVFADIFSAAKRSGQDLTKVIGNTSRIIAEKIEMEQEIDIILASRKYEQNIMSLMPLGILMYLRLTSGGFLETLYSGFWGRMLMTICLMAYLIVWRLGKKMMDIEI